MDVILLTKVCGGVETGQLVTQITTEKASFLKDYNNASQNIPSLLKAFKKPLTNFHHML